MNSRSLKTHSMGLILAALVLLPSCLRTPSYKPRTLQFMHSKRMHRQVKENVILQIKELDEEHKMHLFGEFNAQLQNYSILYFSINNLSPSSYRLSSNYTDLKKLSPSNVIKAMKTNTIGNAAIAGIGAAQATAGTWYALCCFLLPPGLLFPFGVVLSGIAVAGVGITSIFTGKSIKSSIINSRISKDLKNKMRHENKLIPSGRFYEGLIFVKASDLKANFSIILQEENSNNPIQFNITL